VACPFDEDAVGEFLYGMGEQKSYFSFTKYDADVRGGVVRFYYELAHGDSRYTFCETLKFTPPAEGRNISEPVLTRFFEELHIILGISYWKLTCAKDIRVLSHVLSQKQADFWNTVYTKGLGEFYFKNSIDFRDLVHFPYEEKDTPSIAPSQKSDRALVLLGSGKDSIVTAELLKKHKKVFSHFSLNPRDVHHETAAQIGGDFITAHREIDPKLFELNKTPGMYNGHIPITAIVSSIAVFLSYIYDFGYVVVSNEESANYGNVEYLGTHINHQWSKSYEFEQLFVDYLRFFVTGDIQYFSLVRPLTELHITQLFTQYSTYFDTFTSCNKNFGVIKATPNTRWCGECPKCAFVFLLLAAFLTKDTVVSIFHKNLFANEKLITTYKELLGIAGIKPFECVGTPQESLWAIVAVINKKEFQDDVVIKTLLPEIEHLKKEKEITDKEVLGVSTHHQVPQEFASIIQSI
jgi:UDP-N-acetyl-alpha-D-muramoyl-L-alanyl-L-glutamate epimerase